MTGGWWLRFLHVLTIGFATAACSASEEPREQSTAKTIAAPPLPAVEIARLDRQIRPGAWRPLTKRNSLAAYRKFGADRLADANALAPWAARNSLEQYCREVKGVRLSPDATRRQLSFSVSCDGTMVVDISEKATLQTRHRIDPVAYPDSGESLADMYRRSSDGSAVDIERTAATIINLNRHLCARVTNISQLRVRQGVYEVTCVEYRGGTGTVRYLLDAPDGIASPL